MFCQFRQISSSIGIYTSWVNIGVWTKSAILAMFYQFRQITSSIGIYTTRVNIGDFDKFGNYSCHFTVRLITTLFTNALTPFSSQILADFGAHLSQFKHASNRHVYFRLSPTYFPVRPLNNMTICFPSHLTHSQLLLLHFSYRHNFFKET